MPRTKEQIAEERKKLDEEEKALDPKAVAAAAAVVDSDPEGATGKKEPTKEERRQAAVTLASEETAQELINQLRIANQNAAKANASGPKLPTTPKGAAEYIRARFFRAKPPPEGAAQ